MIHATTPNNASIGLSGIDTATPEDIPTERVAARLDSKVWKKQQDALNDAMENARDGSDDDTGDGC